MTDPTDKEPTEAVDKPIQAIDPDISPIVEEIAAHHTSLTPLQRIAVATALELLSEAARYAEEARRAGGYATTDRGALAVHPGARHARELRRDALAILTAVLSTDAVGGDASAAARAMNAARWGKR